ncbi:MAG: hypothetical protein UDC79_03780 [Acutalibacteraceae bacterium]|nr:hypothetical protein [Acutalibacteraceae bacterium]
MLVSHICHEDWQKISADGVHLTDVLIALAKLYNTSTDYILGLTNKK